MAPMTAALLASLSLLSGTQAVRLFATHFSGQIYSLELNTASSSPTLTQVAKTSGCGVTPSWLHLDEARNLYCIDESWQGSGVLSQWSIQSNGALTLAGKTTTKGNSVHGSTYGGTNGRGFLITSEYSPSTITTYKLPITSSTKPIQTLTFSMSKPGPRPDRQDKPHPHSGFTDPTGSYVLVPDLGADLTRIFKINNSTGALLESSSVASNPGDGPRHGVFRQVSSGAWKYYSLNEVSSSVGVYDVDYSSGALSLKLTATHSTYGPNVALGNATVKAAEIRIAGSTLYASNRNDSGFGKEQDSIAQFSIGDSGALTWAGLANSYSYYPRSFSINKAGTLVAVGGQTTANIAIVERNVQTGKLGKLVANLVLPPRGTYGGEDGISAIIWDEPAVKTTKAFRA